MKSIQSVIVLLIISLSSLSYAEQVTASDPTPLSRLRAGTRIFFNEVFEIPEVADPAGWPSHHIQYGKITSTRNSPGYLRRDDAYCEIRLSSLNAIKIDGKIMNFSENVKSSFKGTGRPQTAVIKILNDGQIEELICRKSSGEELTVGDLKEVFGDRITVKITTGRGEVYPPNPSKQLQNAYLRGETLEVTFSPTIAYELKRSPMLVLQHGNWQNLLRGWNNHRANWCIAEVNSASVGRSWEENGSLNRIILENTANGFSVAEFRTLFDKMPVKIRCYRTDATEPFTVADINQAAGSLIHFEVRYSH